MRSRLEHVKRVARLINKHLWGIGTAMALRTTNAASESVNAKVLRVQRNACGFRNGERFRNAILFHLGRLDLYPSHGLSTHTTS
jgi:transposase